MARRMETIMIQSKLLFTTNESCARSYFVASTFPSVEKRLPLSRAFSDPVMDCLYLSQRSRQNRRLGWKIASAIDVGGVPDDGEQENLSGDGPRLGQTRLSRIVIAGGRQLLGKLNSARKNFPMKIFLLLLGFYTANALATILGQTGDWDVLVAGVVVAAIEVGMFPWLQQT